MDGEENEITKQEEGQQDEGRKQPQDGAGDGAADDGGQQQGAQQGGTVNAHKHARDIAKLQKRISELEGENAALKGGADGIAALTKRLDDMEAAARADKTGSELKAAGCIDVKAASARLDEFDGDVAKLKEAAPYLFASSDNSKSTGGTPKGKAGDGDIDDKLDRAFGLKK